MFIAGRKVGPTGRAIGVDMTPEMLAKARKNIATYRERTGLDNVEFRLGEIEHLPVADASVDVVISNCVINLSPDKPQVWREIARVLKPGGRVAVSDLALLKPLPPAVVESGRGAGGLRGRRGAGLGNGADGQGGGPGGHRAQGQVRLHRRHGGLAGPALSEDRGPSARRDEAERLRHQPGNHGAESLRGRDARAERAQRQSRFDGGSSCSDSRAPAAAVE